MENNFASNLKRLRQMHNWTQEELGKKLDKDYSTIGKWENGTRSPIMEDVVNLAKIFDISIEELIGKNNEMSQEDIELQKQNNILFDKLKNLSNADRELVINLIETRKKQIDKELGED